MTVILGILVLHFLILLRSRMTAKTAVPYYTVFSLSVLIVLYVVFMMFTMAVPETN